MYDDILAQYNNPVLLKKGGQKSAYRISHPQYGAAVLKVGTYNSLRDLERIRREVITLQEIDSEYYPKNYDFTILEDDRFVIIEEYIPSRPLSECLTEYTEPRQALELIRRLVFGLSVLWNRKIVHRDVKPDNTLITEEGDVKIIDLGVARLLDMDSLTTLHGAPLTRRYAAPEQIRYNSSAIDIRTDQFPLGIILVQLLLGGGHPFDPKIVGKGGDIVENILSNTWHSSFLTGPRLSNIKPIVSKLLGLQPYQRYRSADSLLQALNQCLERIS